MMSDRPIGGAPPSRRKISGGAKDVRPEWANGLRQLYEAVVDEPIPDSFRDLLSKLDSKD